MAINKIADQIVTKWIIDPGQSKAEIKELAKGIKEQIKVEKDLGTVRSRVNQLLEKQNQVNKEASKRNRELAKSFVPSILKGNLYQKTIDKVVDSLKNVLKASNSYVKAQNVFTGNIEKARAATGGLVTDLELMEAQNKLNTLGVTLTTDEYADLLKGATKLSDAMGITMSEALDSTATALARGSVMVADNIGVTIKAGEANEKYAQSLGKLASDLTESEKKLAFQAEFIEQVRNKSAELPDIIDSTGNVFQRATTELSNFFTQMTAGLNRSAKFTLFMKEVVNQVKAIANFMRQVGVAIGILDSNLDLTLKKMRQTGRVSMGIMGLDKEAYLKARGQQLDEEYAPTAKGRDKATLKMEKQRAKREATLTRSRRRRHEQRLKDDEKYYDNLDALRKKQIDRENKDEDERFKKQQKRMIMLNEIMFKRGQDIRDVANRIMEQRKEQRELKKEEESAAKSASLTGQMQTKAFESIDQAKVDMLNTGVSAFSSLGSAMFQAAEAAEASGESFEKAMGKIVKATLKGIAITSTVKALEALALAAFNAAMLDPPAAAAALKSAALYTATAIAAGAASAAIGGGGGGAAGAGAGARSRVRNDIYEDPQRQRPQFAKKEQARAPINIQLYVGDPDNPSSALVAREQLNAQLSQRQQSEFSEI